MFATVDAYNVSLFLHISAVVIGFGATFAQSVTFPVAMSTSTRHLPYLHKLHSTINRYMTSPALLLIIITGFYQLSQSHDAFKLDQFWVWSTLLITVILGAMNGAYFIPTDKKLGEQAERELAAGGAGEVEMSADYQAAAKKTGMVGAVAGALVLLAVFLMVTKLGV